MSRVPGKEGQLGHGDCVRAAVSHGPVPRWRLASVVTGSPSGDGEGGMQCAPRTWTPRLR